MCKLLQRFITASLIDALDTVEYLAENGTFVLAPFTLPNPVTEHCSDAFSETEALIYGGKLTLDVYVINFGKGGQVTPKAPLHSPGFLNKHASCGSFYEDGVKYAIYAGGLDAR